MFYCNKCADPRGWPTDPWLPKSIGMCEMCRQRANCYDVPSSHLPQPPPPFFLKAEEEAIESIQQTIEKRSHSE